MKSYFSKLADRATLANVPAPSTVRRPAAPDPFEKESRDLQVSPVTPKSIESPRAVSKLNATDLKPPVEVPRVKTPHQTEELQERLTTKEISKSDPIQPLNSKTDPVTQETKVTEVVQLETKSVVDHRTVEEPALKTREVVNLVPREAEEQTLTPSSKRKVSPELADENESVDFEDEQKLLLRKADAFMSSLFDLQPKTSDELEQEVVEKPETIRTVIETQPSNRLEPTQRTREATPEQSGPSLVIGKLTVEVTSPAPAPAPVTPPQIVIRGPANRRSGIISARRFGLRQF